MVESYNNNKNKDSISKSNHLSQTINLHSGVNSNLNKNNFDREYLNNYNNNGINNFRITSSNIQLDINNQLKNNNEP